MGCFPAALSWAATVVQGPATERGTPQRSRHRSCRAAHTDGCDWGSRLKGCWTWLPKLPKIVLRSHSWSAAAFNGFG